MTERQSEEPKMTLKDFLRISEEDTAKASQDPNAGPETFEASERALDKIVKASCGQTFREPTKKRKLVRLSWLAD